MKQAKRRLGGGSFLGSQIGVSDSPREEAALANALEPLLLAPQRARSMGEAGRAIVRERFNVETMAAQMAGICAGAARKFAS